jgi:hypothetical protein
MDAVQALLRLLVTDLSLPDTTQVELIAHESKLNWRQRYPTVRDQVQNLRDGLIHDGPFHGRLIRIDSLEEEIELMATQTDEPDVVSVTSRLFDHDGNPIGHTALMNLHPEGFDSVDSIVRAIREITAGMPGYLLSSGRHYHYYGCRILCGNEWDRFLAQFLMPCVMVSPRYIGHSLFQGFCAVRLTAAAPHKPTVPTLLMIV